MSLRGEVGRYGGAVLVVGLGLAARLLTSPWFGEHSPYLVFTLAVIVAARFWGAESGYVATAVSAAAAVFLIVRPQGELAAASLVAFLLTGFLSSFLIGRLGE